MLGRDCGRNLKQGRQWQPYPPPYSAGTRGGVARDTLTRLGRHGSDCADENQEEEEAEEALEPPASSSSSPSPPAAPFLANHDDIFGRLAILGREVGRSDSLASPLPSARDKYSCSSRFNSVMFVYM